MLQGREKVTSATGNGRLNAVSNALKKPMDLTTNWLLIRSMHLPRVPVPVRSHM